MEAAVASSSTRNPSHIEQEHLSYKFQRLRERIRRAVASGELSGKLPGERELARRFKANPKTLSKALTDLAAEGLLDRSIGRGTFVRGTVPSTQRAGRWLALCDSADSQGPIIEQLRQIHADLEVVTSDSSLRPGFVSRFGAFIDLASTAPESLHRSLLVRGIPVVLLNREPGMYKVHAVLLDRAHAAHRLARDMLLGGHRRIVVVEDLGSTAVSDAVRLAGARYAPHAAVEACTIGNTQAILDRITTAILCDGPAYAQRVRQLSAEHGHLSRVSLAAVGIGTDEAPCTGIYASPADLARAAAELLRDGRICRPTVIWLSGTHVDCGTICAIPENRFELPKLIPPAAVSA